MSVPLHIGVVTAYPDEDWHSRRLIAAARKRGRVTIVRPEALAVRLADGKARVLAAGVDVRRYALLLLPRALGEKGSADFQVEVYRLASEQGAVMVNEVDALLAAVDKFRSSVLFERAGVPTPASAVVQELADARAVVADWGAAVCKPLFGSLGRGVRLVQASDASALARLLKRHRALYLQRYVESSDGDLRAFVVGSRVVAAVRRRAKRGDFRTNAGRAAGVAKVELDARLCALSVRAARAVGLDYTGVDLVEGPDGPLVLEVNGAPRWESLEETTGCDVASAIVAHAIERRNQFLGSKHTPTARSFGNG
jgi:tetrahydromethanopterin:alpha-L-glutamate ligase